MRWRSSKLLGHRVFEPPSKTETDRGATTARHRRSAGPTRRTSSSPEQIQQRVEIGDAAQRVVEMRAGAGTDELTTNAITHVRQRHSANPVSTRDGARALLPGQHPY